MDKTTSEKVVLLSIKPKYANAILDGVKTIEFRKKGFNFPIEKIIIYASSPTKRIVGYFYVKSIHQGKPDNIWNEFGKQGFISKEDFFKYYKNSTLAIAISIECLHSLKDPVELKTLDSQLKPPQSYRYINVSVFEKLEKHKNFDSGFSSPSTHVTNQSKTPSSSVSKKRNNPHR